MRLLQYALLPLARSGSLNIILERVTLVIQPYLAAGGTFIEFGIGSLGLYLADSKVSIIPAFCGKVETMWEQNILGFSIS